MIGFAHRGAPQHRGLENSLEAFERALSLGANGLESDIALTADGVPLLAHLGLSFRGPRISRMRRDDLPGTLSLAQLYEQCGSAFELSLDMGAPDAVEEVVRIAEEYGAEGRLWLTYWKLPVLEAWRRRWPHVHLVYPAMPLGRKRSTRLLERLSSIGVDALNVHYRFHTRGLAELAWSQDILLFAWGIRNAASLRRVVSRGIDGVYCDDAEAMGRMLAGNMGQLRER